MPVIGRFYSIIIKMHYIEGEHNPPHIHAYYNEYEGIFDIRTGNLVRGRLPDKIIGLVQLFINQFKERLLEMWEKQNFELLKFGE